MVQDGFSGGVFLLYQGFEQLLVVNILSLRTSWLPFPDERAWLALPLIDLEGKRAIIYHPSVAVLDCEF
jgi:hypothetical protein